MKSTTIVIGRNNAGKSTLVEAFRLLATVSSRYRSLTYKPAPKWGGIPKRDFGVTPSLRGLEIRFDTLFHQYTDPPAIIDATFASGHTVTLYLGTDERVHAVIRDERGDPLHTKAAALRLDLPRVEILPQIGPLSLTETELNPEYVRGALSSNLASLHFRNQLIVSADQFASFKEFVETTWPGLQVKQPVRVGRAPETSLFMEVRNEAFVGEVSTMGHGLQMWLQTMWFLARAGRTHTVILDEPDVYMHPDLQRRLIRFLRRRFPQVIVATHSVEIMAEVEPEDILVIDRGRRRSQFTSSLPAVQRLIDHVGSVHNIHLAKLWLARKCLHVEGDDLKLLSEFQQTLSPNIPEALTSLPNMSLGGWGGWQHAVGSSLFLQNLGGENIASYCLLDSDYWTDEAIADRYQEATRANVYLHVWQRKEIENYLLAPAAIARYITARQPVGAEAPESGIIQGKLEEYANARWDETFDAFAATILARDRGLGAGGANQRARDLLGRRCPNRVSLLQVISGKRLLADLSSWSQQTYSVGINATALARTLGQAEIPAEVAQVLASIAQGRPLSPWQPRYGMV